MKNQIPNPYLTLTALVVRHNLWLPKPLDGWRLVQDPVLGQINGLPNFRGFAVATNGIMVVLDNLLDAIHIGHIDWFLADEQEPEEQEATRNVLRHAAAGPKKIDKQFDELFL